MTCPSKVRIAHAEDHQEVWRLFLQAHHENGVFSLDAAKVDWWLRRVLSPETISPGDTGPRGAIGVIGNVGSLEGLAFLTFAGCWYSNEMHLEEFTVYVDPECRKSNHAKALIRWMKEQSKLTGLPLAAGIMSNHRTEEKIRLYSRLLPKAGEFFLFNPNSVNASMATAGSS